MLCPCSAWVSRPRTIQFRYVKCMLDWLAMPSNVWNVWLHCKFACVGIVRADALVSWCDLSDKKVSIWNIFKHVDLNLKQGILIFFLTHGVRVLIIISYRLQYVIDWWAITRLKRFLEWNDWDSRYFLWFLGMFLFWFQFAAGDFRCTSS